MAKFRKKPVVIEAMELTKFNAGAVRLWCGGKYWSRLPARAVTGITVETLSGDDNASYGDWILKYEDGVFDIVKPDIFVKIYEAVEEGTAG